MPNLDTGDFKIAYACTAMPIRFAVERHRWSDASALVPPVNAPPHVVALAVWARGLGLARGGHVIEAQREVQRLRQIAANLHASGNSYWAAQVEILIQELAAWIAQAENKPEQAMALMRSAADQEDAIEKLPVTPGPVVPAREQLGSLLLEQNQPALALKEFNLALVNAPGRRNALQGAAIAASQTTAQSAK
jgi:hypothetical protein